MDKFTLSELRNPVVYSQFTSASTFYIPPRQGHAIDLEIASSLGLSDATHISDIYPYSAWSGSINPPSTPYGPFERQAVAKLSHYKDYQYDKNHYLSPAMQTFMADLALYPRLAAEYAIDPLAYVEKKYELTRIEKYALSFNDPATLYALSKMGDVSSSGLTRRGEASMMDYIARSVTDTGMVASFCLRFPSWSLMLVSPMFAERKSPGDPGILSSC